MDGLNQGAGAGLGTTQESPIVLRTVVYWLEDRHPRIAAWLGERLDLQLPAWGVSLATHVILLFLLGMVGLAAHEQDRAAEFRTEVVSTSLADFAKLDTAAVVESEKPTQMAPVAGSFGPVTSALLVQPPLDRPPPPVAPVLNVPGLAKIASVTLPAPTHLDRTVSIQGSGAEHVGSVEGAVDRIALEILGRLAEGPTLVVWAFDASGSLASERQRLTKYIDGVYEHVLRSDAEGRAGDEGLLTTVVAFGQERKVLMPEPTADRKAIAAAIAAVPLDRSGVETTFHAVGEAAKKFGRFSKGKLAYRAMIVVVTDEVGDDDESLEAAIAAARAVKAPVYVLGSPALFGREDGYMDYTDPKTHVTHRGLPVKQGPESAALEGIKLPFWYGGEQYEFLDAGFGPYALSRLAGATGGVYFITRMANNRITFDPAGMREYRPDYASKDQYVTAVNRDPLRLAVMRASLITRHKVPGQPSLQFPAADGPEFKEAMKRNQEIVALIQLTVDEALGANQPPSDATILSVARRRDHEPSRRWQAHYDLIRGRLLAMKTRCLAYNTFCARMIRDPLRFQNPASNAWKMRPDEDLSFLKARDLSNAQEAQDLLQRVVKDHPGTPWGLLAKRELQHPFGFRWEEVTVPPPPKRNDQDAAARKKKAENKPAPNPADRPKL